MEVEAAVVDDDEGRLGHLPRLVRADPEPADGQVAGAPAPDLLVEDLEVERVEPAVRVRRVDQADRRVRQDPVEVDHRGADQIAPDPPAVLELRQVARRQLERLDELLLAVAAEGPRKVDRPRRVVEALGRLQPADLVEEPAATGVHEHRVALHLEQPEHVADLGIVEVGVPVAAEEKADSLRVAVEDHVDVGVPRLPGIGEALARGC